MAEKCLKPDCDKLKFVNNKPLCHVDGVPIRYYKGRGRCVLEMSKYEAKKVKQSFYDLPDAYIKEFYNGVAP